MKKTKTKKPVDGAILRERAGVGYAVIPLAQIQTLLGLSDHFRPVGMQVDAKGQILLLRLSSVAIPSSANGAIQVELRLDHREVDGLRYNRFKVSRMLVPVEGKEE